jgi:hypothetical protein
VHWSNLGAALIKRPLFWRERVFFQIAVEALTWRDLPRRLTVPSVRISCRVQQVARYAGLRRAGRAGHQPARTRERSTLGFNEVSGFVLTPLFTDLGPLGPSLARALANDRGRPEFLVASW